MSSTDGPTGPALRLVQRTGAYAVVRDRSGRPGVAGAALLVRASSRSDLRGYWFLPGGGLRHGEHPRDGVLRELAEETGLVARRVVPVSATSDVIDLPHRGVRLHTLRLIYEVTIEGLRTTAVLRPEADGTSDLARFVPPGELAGLRLMPFVAEVLGVPQPEPPTASPPDRPEPLGAEPLGGPRDFDPLLGPGDRPAADQPAADQPAADRPAASRPAASRSAAAEQPVRVQRPAAYAVLVDESAGPHAHRILLTRLADSRTTSRTGTWTLPGGGIDHGEHPLVALEREVHEEAGLVYTAGPLLDIGSRHFVGRAPNGRLEDFQGLRLVYSGSVPLDREPQVIEVDGSTDAAAWFPVSELDRITTVPAVRDSLATWAGRRRAGHPSGR